MRPSVQQEVDHIHHLLAPCQKVAAVLPGLKVGGVAIGDHHVLVQQQAPAPHDGAAVQQEEGQHPRVHSDHLHQDLPPQQSSIDLGDVEEDTVGEKRHADQAEDDEPDEEDVVAPGDATEQEEAVVVHPQHALSTKLAMLGQRRLDQLLKKKSQMQLFTYCRLLFFKTFF